MEENGITLSELFTLMFKNWKRLVIITLSIFVIGVLGIHFIYNYIVEYYEVKFEFRYTTLENGLYYDGSPFDYRTICDYENIVKVIEENSELKKLDAEDIYEDGINIEEVRVTNEDGDEILYDYYRIELAKCNFKDDEQAALFVKTLIEIPLEKNKELITESDLTYNLDAYDSSLTFSKKIDYLEAQYDLINSLYNKLISSYGSIKLSSGKTVRRELTEIVSTYEANNISSYLSIVEANCLVYDYSYSKPALESKKISLTNTLQTNLEKINELTTKRDELLNKVSSASYSADIESYNNSIQELVKSNEDINYQLEIIDKKLKNEDDSETNSLVKSIVEALDNYRDILEDETTLYKNTAIEASNNTRQVYYGSNEIVTEEGGIGLIKSAVISGFVGLFVAVIVNVIYAWKPFQDEKKNKN